MGGTVERGLADCRSTDARGVPVILVFEDCELDLARVVLTRAGQEVRVEPQVFDLLRCLIDRRGEVVRKEELLDQVWGDRFVSESALTTRIKSARQAVGDDGRRQRVIRTVHGKGYEFVAPVRVVDARSNDRPDTGGAAGSSCRLPSSRSSVEELLSQLLDDHDTSRLITLVGTGGVGKTSVAFELARRVELRYPDGVLVVELASVVDHDAALAAFATSLDVNTRQRASIEDAIVDMLRPRRALLVLDNCEHLVEPVASLVDRILLRPRRSRSSPRAANRSPWPVSTCGPSSRCPRSDSTRSPRTSWHRCRQWRCSSSGPERLIPASS